VERIIQFVVLLAFFGFSSSNIAFAADIDAPKLKSWKITSPTRVDISIKNAVFEVALVLTDDSQINSIKCNLGSENSRQYLSSYGEFISKNENSFTYALRFEIEVGRATGNWYFLCFAEDKWGNSADFRPPVGSQFIFIYDKETIAQEIENQAKEKIYNENQEKIEAEKAALASRESQSILVSPNIKGSIQLKVRSITIKSSASSNLPISVRTSTTDTCLYVNGKIQLKSIGRCVVAFSQDGNNEFKAAESKVLAFKIVKK
jgi:hypothetical protein